MSASQLDQWQLDRIADYNCALSAKPAQQLLKRLRRRRLLPRTLYTADIGMTIPIVLLGEDSDANDRVAAYLEPEYDTIDSFVGLPDLFDSFHRLAAVKVRAICIGATFTVEENEQIQDEVDQHSWRDNKPVVITTKPPHRGIAAHIKHLPYEQRVPTIVQELLDNVFMRRTVRVFPAVSAAKGSEVFQPSDYRLPALPNLESSNIGGRASSGRLCQMASHERRGSAVSSSYASSISTSMSSLDLDRLRSPGLEYLILSRRLSDCLTDDHHRRRSSADQVIRRLKKVFSTQRYEPS